MQNLSFINTELNDEEQHLRKDMKNSCNTLMKRYDNSSEYMMIFMHNSNMEGNGLYTLDGNNN